MRQCDVANQVPALNALSPQYFGPLQYNAIGFYMRPSVRAIVGGATSLQIWKDGKPVYNATLAATPSAAELDACVRPLRAPGEGESEG
jgi:hypothetical protein